jgi:SH3-like domain-containing protein
MSAGRIAVLALALIMSAHCAWAETIYVNTDKAKLRSGPGTSYKTLWEARKYTPLEYLAKYKDWYVARDYQGDVGWIQEQSVAKGRAAIVIGKKANIRKGPGPNHPMLFTVEERYLFKVVEEKKEWVKVLGADGDGGWVLKELLWMSR